MLFYIVARSKLIYNQQLKMVFAQRLFMFCIALIVNATFCYSAKPNVHVVLGSANDVILGERIQAAIQYIRSAENQNILFISGGVKNALVDANEQTEAAKAANIIKNNVLDDVQIVLEENATNTAENFVYLKRWVNNNFSQEDLPEFIITTSDFHKNRAEQIFQGILPDITPKWNLSKSDCIQCWKDEAIHIKNVHADIYKAMNLM
jgi:uncharacterized SAM-binding protein YcdF (DUF218 family)